MHPPAKPDPILQAEVERALAPYAALLPAELLEEMRRLLLLGATHPYAAQLLKQLQPAPTVDESGEVLVGAVMDDPRAASPQAVGVPRPKTGGRR
jgi:hypothetical protein